MTLKGLLPDFTQVEYVKAMELPRDSVIVVKIADNKVTPMQAASIRDRVSEVFPEHRVIVLAPEMDIAIAKEQEVSGADFPPWLR